MYFLDFHPDALKEWQKLDHSIRDQFKAKLKNVCKILVSYQQGLKRIVTK
jgi:hypothetical protein